MKVAERTLNLHPTVSKELLESAVVETLETKGLVDIRPDPDDETVIVARTPPRLLTWGEEVSVDIDEASIRVANTQQTFDWGSSERLATRLKASIEASAAEEALREAV
jgi:hypothetical protein